MKTINKIQVIVFKKDNVNTLFLILKTNPERGGFWQPITGSLNKNESFEKAALRELKEELGNVETTDLIDTGYSFEFLADNRQNFEKIFGVKVPANTEIKLSPEHTEFKWVTKDKALELIKYPSNKKGLKKLCEKLV